MSVEKITSHNQRIEAATQKVNTLPVHENVEPEVSEQEDIIAQIKAVLPFKGAGASEGQYVWKKCEYFAGQTLSNATFKVTSTGSTTYTITDANFPLVAVKDDWLFLSGFANGAVKFSTVNSRLAFATSVSEVYVNELTVSNDGKTINIVVGGALGDVNTILSCANKTVPEIMGDIVGYLLSNDETAYPSGGVGSDGYWYELIEAEGSAGIDFGFVTLTTTTSNLSIEHSLGVVPTTAMLIPYTGVSGETGSSGTYLMIHSGNPIIRYMNYNTLANVYGYCGYKASGTYSDRSTTVNEYGKRTSKTITFTPTQYDAEYVTRGTYLWIAIA